MSVDNRLQIQVDSASCFITSIAMVMDYPVEDLIKEVGKDHTAILHPGRTHGLKFRGHHYQDLTETLLNHGWALIPNYGRYPIMHPYPKGCMLCGGSGKFKGKWEEGNLLISRGNGVLQYGAHSCAWIDGKVYNPCGKIEAFHTTNLIGFHLLLKVQTDESISHRC